MELFLPSALLGFNWTNLSNAESFVGMLLHSGSLFICFSRNRNCRQLPTRLNEIINYMNYSMKLDESLLQESLDYLIISLGAILTSRRES